LFSNVRKREERVMLELKESETVEFKVKSTDDLKKEVVAFANTKGGTIYIGVEDDGNLAGIEGSSEHICEQVSSMVRDGIKPDVTMLISCNCRKNRSQVYC
jgi:ATP-dependent DNA helicase RecG